MNGVKQTVLWWGKFDSGYSRNRIMKNAFVQLGWNIRSFVPRNTRFGYLEARLKRVASAELVFVPCFCQKDIDTAIKFGCHHGIPVMIDPLISLYDSRVFERQTVAEGSSEAKRLLDWERSAFSRADGVIADTVEHGRYYSEVLGVEPGKIQVVPVSAEEELFVPANDERVPQNPIQVLFYGSFIPLQGVDVIVDAIRAYDGPKLNWCLLGGTGSACKQECEQALAGVDNVVFEENIPYASLSARIHQADILLGVFGKTDKTVRVIPNKVYQAIACAKPVVTCDGPYPVELSDENESGIVFVPPGNAKALADTVARLAAEPERLALLGRRARQSYERFFDNRRVCDALGQALNRLMGAV